MELSAALGQEGVSRVSSYISAKIDDRSSRAHTVARLEESLFRLEHALERTATLPITYISLLRRRKVFVQAYIKGTQLLNKDIKLQELQGNQEAGQVVVVRSCSYLERILSSAAAATLSAAAASSSLFGFVNKEHHLSSSDVREFEWYADCAEKFVARVESSCPLRRDITFRYPFVRQLLQGKTIRYRRKMEEGSQAELWFDIDPVVLEGRGVEASIWYRYHDFERQDKNLRFRMMLRLSESTDIVGVAIICLRSSSSLLNLVAGDATGQLPLLHNLQGISASYDHPPGLGSQKMYALIARTYRSDPVCCHANEHNPGANKDIAISSELSHMFPEQVIQFDLECYTPAAEYNLPRASDKPSRIRIRNLMMIDRAPPLKLSLSITPHKWFDSAREEGCYISKKMGISNEERSPYGSIQQTIGTVRSEAIDCLTRQPEVDKCAVSWRTKHGYARFLVNKTITSGSRYNTRGGAKRKR